MITDILKDTVFFTFLIPFFIVLLGLIANIITDLIVFIIELILGSTIAFALANYLTFPGTVHHELSHALFAILTGAKVRKIQFFQEIGFTLGSVDFEPRGNDIMKSIQVTLTSIAPVVCGFITSNILAYLFFNHCHENWQYILTVYLFICIIIHMNMSFTDILNCLHGLPYTMLILFILSFIILIIMHFTGHYDIISDINSLKEVFSKITNLIPKH